ncbi:hypothetical protein IFO69_16220 [Echinicola sp. CAU 1574]|uniref:Uncharacterized protein n=1 Tax=Echinicola arenosa TaxID=2774144 RepID=A0ABR9ANZ9_9BACT|nr:hypothetical protein [Echinicola arenosa]MBD8490299.1 hypothetical protein [Echinicola arenosa]
MKYFFSISTLFAQTASTYIILNPDKIPVTVREFYFKDVVDLRREKATIGGLFTSREAKFLEPLEIKGGAVHGLRAYFQKGFLQDKTLRPIVVQIKKCQVIEKRLESGVLEGTVDLGFVFNLSKGDSLIHLMDYNGGARYKRSLGNYEVVTTALKQSLSSSVKYFNNWMNEQVKTNIKLAKSVKLEFVDHDLRENGDTVFYNTDRPLVWEDFKARPHTGSKFAASIFTSFAWEGDSEVMNGVVHVKFQTKIFMLKSSSWVKGSAKDAYGLNHERRHFDITKIVVERFKEKVSMLNLEPDNYDGAIGYLYIETYREMNQMQEAYDEETSHGQNRSAQERWNDYIDEELAQFSEMD